MDMASEAIGEMVSISAGLYFGTGGENSAFSEGGVQDALGPSFGSSGRRRDLSHGAYASNGNISPTTTTPPLAAPPGAAYRIDSRADRTKEVGASIQHELSGGNVQEAFHHLKGWYRAASETTTRPCPLTMERQTAERVALYARRDSPGEPLPINIPRVDIADHTPTDGEIREAARELSNGRAGGASGMRAEDVKAWLHGIKLEEDPKTGPTNENAGDWVSSCVDHRLTFLRRPGTQVG
jgi:hypothetical protein